MQHKYVNQYLDLCVMSNNVAVKGAVIGAHRRFTNSDRRFNAEIKQNRPGSYSSSLQSRRLN